MLNSLGFATIGDFLRLGFSVQFADSQSLSGSVQFSSVQFSFSSVQFSSVSVQFDLVSVCFNIFVTFEIGTSSLLESFLYSSSSGSRF